MMVEDVVEINPDILKPPFWISGRGFFVLKGNALDFTG
jgi:hypothetical protein